MELIISEVTGVRELADVNKFVEEVFVPGLPDLHIFGVPITPSIFRWCIPSTQEKGSRDFVLKAENSSDGKTIGISIVKEEPYLSNECLQRSMEMEQLDEFLEFLESAANLPNLPGGTIELSVLSVTENWRGRGVARRLAEESSRVARALGYAAIKMFCTSEFTARLARGLGWREHYQIRYADYPELSGRKVQLMPYPPHDCAYYFIKEF